MHLHAHHSHIRVHSLEQTTISLTHTCIFQTCMHAYLPHTHSLKLHVLVTHVHIYCRCTHSLPHTLLHAHPAHSLLLHAYLTPHTLTSQERLPLVGTDRGRCRRTRLRSGRAGSSASRLRGGSETRDTTGSYSKTRDTGEGWPQTRDATGSKSGIT